MKLNPTSIKHNQLPANTKTLHTKNPLPHKNKLLPYKNNQLPHTKNPLLTKKSTSPHKNYFPHKNYYPKIRYQFLLHKYSTSQHTKNHFPTQKITFHTKTTTPKLDINSSYTNINIPTQNIYFHP